MNGKFQRLYFAQKGQTVVEYILLLLVVVTITVTMAKKLTDHFGANAQDCANGESSNIMCHLYNSLNADTNFRYFRLIGSD